MKSSQPPASRVEQRPKFFECQPRLSKHFVKQPPGNVSFVLVADADSQDRANAYSVAEGKNATQVSAAAYDAEKALFV